MKVTEAILREIAENPERTGVQIAAIVGTCEAYVSFVAKKHGVRYGRAYRNQTAGIVPCHFSPENWDWLKQQLPQGLKISELVNAIITDTRLEEEGH